MRRWTWSQSTQTSTKIELEDQEKPLGTRNSPARTCQDPTLWYPQMKWWSLDWSQPWCEWWCCKRVYCNMTRGWWRDLCLSRCVASRMPNIPGGRATMAGIYTQRQITRISSTPLALYKMTFLRLMSTMASELLSYTCLISAAWYDQGASVTTKCYQATGREWCCVWVQKGPTNLLYSWMAVSQRRPMLNLDDWSENYKVVSYTCWVDF